MNATNEDIFEGFCLGCDAEEELHEGFCLECWDTVPDEFPQSPLPAPVHLQTAASHVKCGASMRHWKTNPGGWDLGNVTVDPRRVTCPNCKR